MSDDFDTQTLYDSVARFAREEIAPHVNDWDTAGEFPRALYRRAAELGLLAIGYPEAYGGVPASYALRVPVWTALCRHGGSGGVLASLFSHNIGLPPVVAHGSEALKSRVVPGVLAGEKIAALAITEPGGGSDVAALRTTARLDGDHYVVDGEKVFITSGVRADWITTAVRTGEPGSKGSGGVSMLLIPGDTPGVSRSPLQKMGWHCSDTAHIRFDGVRVPAANLLGREGDGFRIIMTNFNGERFGMSAAALGFAQACFDEALDWSRQRKTFGAALVERQVIRHKLMDMLMRIQSTEAWLKSVAAQADAGGAGVPPPGRPKAEQPPGGAATHTQWGSVGVNSQWVANVCLLKNHATQTMQFCADQAVQILGGMGYMRGTKSERIYREVKVMMIGGGAEEIMKDLAARQWGL